MYAFFLSVLALQFAVSLADHSNYITENEFEAIHGESIQSSNESLPMPHSATGESDIPRFQARAGFGPRLWTNAQVPYTLDPSFNNNQRRQVALAIQAYHEATCIRFVPKQNHHRSWVDIQYDQKTCGVAQLCMNSGAQYAKFGGNCVNAGVMAHELGHTLCMGHEQTRLDRDEWIGFNRAICEPPRKDGASLSRGLHKLYDYVSIEHYEGECYNGCYKPKQPGVTKCGSGGPLSVLDIEILNEMYGCNSGCLGYRYVNSKNRLNNPVPVGKEPSGNTLYICRAYHQGDIIPGKYHAGRKQCYVFHNGGEHRKTGDHVEVLTNPYRANFQWVRSGLLPKNAIRGGRTNERETLYVIRCQLNVEGKSIWYAGKYQKSTGAYSGYGGREIRCSNFEYLVCVE